MRRLKRATDATLQTTIPMPRRAPTSGGQDDVQIQRPKVIGK